MFTVKVLLFKVKLFSSSKLKDKIESSIDTTDQGEEQINGDMLATEYCYNRKYVNNPLKTNHTLKAHELKT